MADFPVIIRISSYAKLADTWSTVLEFPSAAIEEIRCSFISPHLEDQARVTIIDPGSYGGTVNGAPFVSFTADTYDLFDNYDSQVGKLYRIDIFCPETSDLIDTRNGLAGWQTGQIFWSGFIDQSLRQHNSERRGMQLQCRGWTAYLDRIVLHDHYFANATLRGIVNTLFSHASQGLTALWPGELRKVTLGTWGSDNRLLIESIGWKAATAQSILQQLAAHGNFQFGVSVSGHPFSAGTGDEEFVFLQMFEPAYDVDTADDDFVDHFVDVANNPKVTSYQRSQDDSRYNTRWVFLGEQPYLDFVSVVSGHDRNQINDDFAMSSGASGAFQWEPGGFVGWRIQLLDQAIRKFDRDSATGSAFVAGRIATLPSKITDRDADAAFDILSYTESGGEAIFGVSQFPAPSEDLALDIDETALRYTLVPGDATRVVRIVMDEEKDDGTIGVSRERISRLVEHGSIRGWLQAGLFAAQERRQERFASVHAELRIEDWTRFWSGSSQRGFSRLAISEGTETGRYTLMGTAANGGDEWAVGEDARKVGASLLMDIRRADAVYTESGWSMRFELNGTPRDFATVVLPDVVRGRHRRRN